VKRFFMATLEITAGLALGLLLAAFILGRG